VDGVVTTERGPERCRQPHDVTLVRLDHPGGQLGADADPLDDVLSDQLVAGLRRFGRQVVELQIGER
jgi:hypothetical protein